jgi:hypothetical protein
LFFKLISDLRKEFDTPPYSQQIELGSQAELRCHPPKGSPEARVSHWLKNGEKIEDSNLIQSSAGNLVSFCLLMQISLFNILALNLSIKAQILKQNRIICL